MIELKQNMQDVPSSLLKGLRPYLLLEFYDYPYLTVDITNTGTLFLNYYIAGKGDYLSHIIIEISSERLNLLLKGEDSLFQVFNNPENEVVYFAEFNIKGEIKHLGILDLNLFRKFNPIPINYIIDYELDSKQSEVDLLVKSVQKQKILVDLYLQANSLKSSLKEWPLKSFLIPFSELIRTSLLKESSQYATYSLPGKVYLGINQLAINTFATTIEINYNSDKFGNSKDLENIANLFFILNSKDEDDIIRNIDRFSNKKFILEYLKVLNVIIKNDATLNTKIAAPNNYYSETFISKKEAQKIKQIIHEKIPNV